VETNKFIISLVTFFHGQRGGPWYRASHREFYIFRILAFIFFSDFLVIFSVYSLCCYDVYCWVLCYGFRLMPFGSIFLVFDVFFVSSFFWGLPRERFLLLFCFFLSFEFKFSC